LKISMQEISTGNRWVLAILVVLLSIPIACHFLIDSEVSSNESVQNEHYTKFEKLIPTEDPIGDNQLKQLEIFLQPSMDPTKIENRSVIIDEFISQRETAADIYFGQTSPGGFNRSDKKISILSNISLVALCLAFILNLCWIFLVFKYEQFRKWALALLALLLLIPIVWSFLIDSEVSYRDTVRNDLNTNISYSVSTQRSSVHTLESLLANHARGTDDPANVEDFRANVKQVIAKEQARKDQQQADWIFYEESKKEIETSSDKISMLKTFNLIVICIAFLVNLYWIYWAIKRTLSRYSKTDLQIYWGERAKTLGWAVPSFIIFIFLVYMAFPSSIPGYTFTKYSSLDWYYPSSESIWEIARFWARMVLIVLAVVVTLGVVISKLWRPLEERNLGSKGGLILAACISMASIAILWPLLLANAGSVLAGMLFTILVCVLMAGLTWLLTSHLANLRRTTIILFFFAGIILGVLWSPLLAGAAHTYYYDVTVPLGLGSGSTTWDSKSFPLSLDGELYITCMIASCIVGLCVIATRKVIYRKPIMSAIVFFVPFWPLAILVGRELWRAGLSN